MNVTIENIEGWQARYIIKFADMMRAAQEKKRRVESVFAEGEPLDFGFYHVNEEEFKNCAKIQEIIDSDTIYQ